MKIALVYDCIYPFIKGGAEKRFYEVGRRLSKNHEIHFFGMKAWEGEKTIQQNGCFYHGCGPKRELYNSSGKRKISQAILFSFSLFSELLKNDFDIVDCSSFPYFSVFSCRLACWLKRKPLIVTWHEAWGNYWFEYMGSLGFFGKTIEWLASKLPNQIIAVSEKTKRDLIGLGVNPKKIVVIPNGIDFGAIQKVKPAKKGFDLVFAGRLIKEKNVDLLLDSLVLIKKQKPGISCGIIGEGPEKARLEEKAASLGLNQNVSFLGFFPKPEQVYSIFKASKVFAYPSVREGFGIAVIEANACGLPVLVCRHENNAAMNLVFPGINGLIAQESKSSIAEGIISLLEVSPPKKKVIRSAEPFNWDRLAFELDQQYGACV